MKGVKLSDYGKLIVIVVILVAMSVLAAVGRVSADSAVALYLVVLGYVTGNGVLAVRKKPPSPMVTNPKTARQLAEIRHPAKDPESGPK